MIKEEQTPEMNKLIKRMHRVFGIIQTGYYGGTFDKVLKYIEQEEELIKRFQGDLPKEVKDLHTRWLFLRAINIYLHIFLYLIRGHDGIMHFRNVYFSVLR